MRLVITRRTDLATRALLALAARGQRMKSAELAGLIAASTGFLTQAMTPLVNAGWVRSEPGPTGGYSLTVDLRDVSVLDVIETVEGAMDTSRCVLQNRPCEQEGPCALHHAWQRARTGLLQELRATSLASLAPAAPGVRARAAKPRAR